MLKLYLKPIPFLLLSQPPSGGCVLKHDPTPCRIIPFNQPPSGGCVLKLNAVDMFWFCAWPAAFGRLCVETFGLGELLLVGIASRLRAAVC